MEEAFVDGSAHYEPALKSQGRVNADNWDSLIGVDVPPLGPPDMSKPKPATHYNDYVEFFTAEIAAKGAKPVIDMVRSAVYHSQCHLMYESPSVNLSSLSAVSRLHQKCVMALPEISHMPSLSWATASNCQRRVGSPTVPCWPVVWLGCVFGANLFLV